MFPGIKPDTIWKPFFDVLAEFERQMPKTPPPELPPESDPKFWETAVRIELTTRDTLSAKLRSLLTTGGSPDFSPMECWLFGRRIEFAVQLAYLKMEEGVEPPLVLPELMEWLLVEAWESDGCIAFWNHYQRGGVEGPGGPIVPDQM